MALVLRPSQGLPSQGLPVDNQAFKVIVIGDSRVGKTALTYRFCEGKFPDSAEATIGMSLKSRALYIDGERITLQLWDSAGQERFRKSMTPFYYRNADALILVYDVTHPPSFVSLQTWIEESNLMLISEVPRILVGNKCDGIVAVSTQEALRFGDMHSMPFFETSAKLDSECDNVESIFITLARTLKNRRVNMLNNKNSPLRGLTVSISTPDTCNQSSCSC